MCAILTSKGCTWLLYETVRVRFSGWKIEQSCGWGFCMFLLRYEKEGSGIHCLINQRSDDKEEEPGCTSVKQKIFDLEHCKVCGV